MTDLNTPLPPALGNDALDAVALQASAPYGARCCAEVRPRRRRGVSRVTQPRSAMQTSLAYPTWPPGRHR